MDLEAENRILREMVEFAEDHVEKVSYWFIPSFTTKEFGDEMLSCRTWWEKKKASLKGDKMAIEDMFVDLHLGKDFFRTWVQMGLDKDDFLDELFDHGLYVCVKCKLIVRVSNMPNFEDGICEGCLKENNHG